MSNTVIKVENLGKQYRLGEVGTGTLSHDLNRWWANIRGKEDPFAKIGDTNDRSRKGESQYVWALKNIDFEIKAGEVLGIIGRNGAGKSTLLKILSKVTKPTYGKIFTKGRIASLLEVGTGFHPEMTGRENIFLNGAIMGMTHLEIRSKFDEIVDFAGVERYIDTPVKRYSSGMYVRLAFSVAAHLNSEILVIDEVLAVGDAEFQKKCLGKMGDVSKSEGRTVLFISHNMASIQNLCTRGLLMDKGGIKLEGDIPSTIDGYLNVLNAESSINISDRMDRIGNQIIRFYKVELRDQSSALVNSFITGNPAKMILFYETSAGLKNVDFSMGILDHFGDQICSVTYELCTGSTFETTSSLESIEITFPKLNLVAGNYSLTLFSKVGSEIADWITNAFKFNVEAGDFYGSGKTLDRTQALFLADVQWKKFTN